MPPLPANARSARARGDCTPDIARFAPPFVVPSTFPTAIFQKIDLATCLRHKFLIPNAICIVRNCGVVMTGLNFWTWRVELRLDLDVSGRPKPREQSGLKTHSPS